ncbi:glycosyltransferase family 1 protein [Ceratobasidium sp. AG-Ba]|nr:glycosyltransferase family 1 protein [Ceratobasidium sp. AG-Ba]
MATHTLKHVVFVAGPLWTHVRPNVMFCVRLVEKFPSAYISVYVFGPIATQASAYIATLPEATRSRMRIVPSVVDTPIAGPLDVLHSLEKSFKPWITEQIAIPRSDVDNHVVAAPSWVIEDHINGGCSLGNGLPVASWWVAPAASMIQHFGNPEHGHGGRLYDSILEQLAQQDPEDQKPVIDIFCELLSDRVVYVPGLPPYYEHEQMPQILPHILPMAVQLHSRWNKMREQMEVAILTGTTEIEPLAIEACIGAFTKPIRAFDVGPCVDLPPTAPTQGESDETIQFLEKSLAELGPHSVMYISFGTMFFPLPESARHLEIILEEIVAFGFRIVFSLAAEQAALSPTFIQKISEGGKAIFPKWTKQIQVLEHPAIHYFMTHGGWNSTSEAIVRDVPLIFWPFGGDQCTNSMQIAHQHNCGFELLQIRTGPAKRTAYPNTPILGTDEAVRDEIKNILTMSKGARGAQQRINVKALGKVVRKSLAKGGSGDVALEEFGKLIGL